MKRVVRVHAALCICALSLLASCSSAPPPKDEVSDVKDKAAEYAGYGNAYFSQGRNEQALTFFELALEANISVDYGFGIVQSYYSLGKVNLAIGNYKEAALMYARALAVSERLQNRRLTFQYYTNMGELNLVLHGATQDPAALRQAEKMFAEASELSEQEISDTDRAVLYHDLGTLYKKTGQPQQAIEYIQKAVEINLKQKRNVELGANYYMISSVYSKQQEYDKAQEYAMKALEYDKKAENSMGIAKDLFALGLIYQRLGRTEEAYEYFRKAYLIYQILALAEDSKDVLTRLVDIAAQLGKEDDRSYYQGLLDQGLLD